MKATFTMIGVVAMVLALVGVASASTIFSEDFEGNTSGDLIGYNGWTASSDGVGTIPVGTGGTLATKHVLHNTAILQAAFHSLGSLTNIDPTKITTLQFDAEHGTGYNFELELSQPGSAIVDTGVFWVKTSAGWGFITSPLTGDTGGNISISGGLSGVVHLEIVLDGVAGTVQGYYNFGSGRTPALASPHAVTSAQISSLTQIMLFEDYRSSVGNGAEVDNIVLSSEVPEPGTLVLLAAGLLGLLCYAWRKRR